MTSEIRTHSPAPKGATMGQLPVALAGVAALAALVGARVLDDQSQRIALFVGVLASVLAALFRARDLGAGRSADVPGAKGLAIRALAAHVAMAVGGAAITAALVGGFGDDAVNVSLSLGLLLMVGGGSVVVALALLSGQVRMTGVVDLPRVERATSTAITLVAGLTALGAIVYGLQKDDTRWDLAYAAPTSPSGATLAVVQTSACGEAKTKPEAFLFFERGSTAVGEVRDYFDGLAAAGVILKTQDQALDPALSKDLKVQKNGYVAFRCGEKSETYLIGAEREDAQRKLRKLDQEVRTRLAKISRDPQTIYLTVGHGERAADSSDKSGRTTARSLKKLLDAQNAKLKKFGIGDGSTSKPPDDADLIIVLGPEQPFLPEEVDVLVRYVQGGGSVALFLDPPAVVGGDPDGDVATSLAPLLTTLGVELGGAELLNDKEYVKRNGSNADHSFLFSTSFGTHKVIKTLNTARGRAALLLMSAQSVGRPATTGAPGTTGAPAATGAAGASTTNAKTSLIARSRPATWSDTNGNRSADDAEKRGIVDFAAVAELPVAGSSDGREGRALVVGDSDVIADVLLGNEANAIFAYEALQWLLRDEGLPVDGANVAEDAPIRHTRDEDTAWFYGTTFGAPLLVLIVGGVVTRRRKRPGRARTSSPSSSSPPAPPTKTDVVDSHEGGAA